MLEKLIVDKDTVTSVKERLENYNNSNDTEEDKNKNIINDAKVFLLNIIISNPQIDLLMYCVGKVSLMI